MDAEGMVHALEILHHLVRTDGALVNLQPVGRPRPLELHAAGQVERAGTISHRLNYALHHAALDAVAQVVRDGTFVLEHERTVPFLYHAPSFPVFQAWLSENLQNAILDNRTAERARAISQTLGDDVDVIMREELYLGLLTPA